MSIIKWEPIREIEKFIDESFPSLQIPRFGGDLSVDLYEEGNNVVAKMNLPGIDPEKVDITVEDDFLKVSGTREEEKESKDRNFYSKEIRRGTFQRTVNLPAKVKSEGCKAEYNNGVLTIKMPKMEETKSNRIKIDVGRNEDSNKNR